MKGTRLKELTVKMSHSTLGGNLARSINITSSSPFPSYTFLLAKDRERVKREKGRERERQGEEGEGERGGEGYPSQVIALVSNGTSKGIPVIKGCMVHHILRSIQCCHTGIQIHIYQSINIIIYFLLFVINISYYLFIY